MYKKINVKEQVSQLLQKNTSTSANLYRMRLIFARCESHKSTFKCGFAYVTHRAVAAIYKRLYNGA